MNFILPAPIRAHLDGQSVTIPPARRHRVKDVILYLHTLASKRDRILFRLNIDGAEVPLGGPLPSQPASQVVAESASPQELGWRVLAATLEIMKPLQQRVDALLLLATINNASATQQLWNNVIPDLKQPMLQLSLLQELWGAQFAQLKINGASLENHCDQIGAIQAKLDFALFELEDTAAFAELLDSALLPWLGQLQHTLEQHHA